MMKKKKKASLLQEAEDQTPRARQRLAFQGSKNGYRERPSLPAYEKVNLSDIEKHAIRPKDRRRSKGSERLSNELSVGNLPYCIYHNLVYN